MDAEPRARPARPSWRRFLLASLLGHWAGAYAFCLTAILCAALRDLWTGGLAAVGFPGWSRLFEGVFAFPVVLGLLGFWGAILTLPSIVLTLPVAWAAAYGLRWGAGPTVLLGVATSLVPATLALRGAPTGDPSLYLSTAAAGAAYAGLIWLLCIRPARAQ